MTQSQVRPWLVPAVLASALALCGSVLAQESRPEGEPSTAPAPQAAPNAGPTAQTKTPEEPPRRGPLPGDLQKVFVIRYVRPNLLADLLRVFPADVRSVYSSNLNALAVSAKPAVLAAIEETIKRLDQPDARAEGRGGNVEVTGYLLEGLGEPQVSEPLPSELQGVVAQLRRTFKYPTYRLFDTIVARVRGDGSGFTAGGVTEKKLVPLGPSYYHLEANQTTVVGDAPRAVRLTNLDFGLEIPVPVLPPPPDNSKPIAVQYKRIGLHSDIDIRDGQYVVVGKSGLGDSDNALVLVLTAKVVD